MRSRATVGPVFDVVADLDVVDDAAFDEVFERPSEVLGRDAVHGGAEAAGIVEGDDALALGASGGPCD